MGDELVDNLEDLIEEAWKKGVRKDFQGSPRYAYHEADLVASFYHHLRARLEKDKEKYNVRLGRERGPGRPLSPEKSKKTWNDLHIISCEGEQPTLIVFEFKCKRGVTREDLEGDRKKLKNLQSLDARRGYRVKRGYMCIVDRGSGSENNVTHKKVQISRPPEDWEKGFYREAYGTKDRGQEDLWRMRRF